LRPEVLLLALALASPAAAQGLEGRTVLIRPETWDDPAAPYVEGRDYVARVGEGPEIDVLTEWTGGLVVVPVTIDLSDSRIDIVFPPETLPGVFAEAAFNGYVLTFPTDCAVIEGAAIDPEATTLALGPEDLIVEPTGLRLHVGGRAHGPGSRVGLLIDVGDCAIS
jgi:hypothetical protein